jgi:hypothetical protein
LPPLAVIQFPWRLLALTALTLSALAGLVVYGLATSNLVANRSGDLGLVAVLVIFGSAGYVNAQLQPIEPWREDGRAIFRFEQEHPDMIAYTQWVKEPFQSSPMTKDYASDSYHDDHGVTESLERLTILHGSGQVVSNYSHGSSFGGVVQLADAATVRINVFYFPGWQVKVDGTVVAHRISDPAGLVEVDVPAGQHQIDMRMGSTPDRLVGALISWAMVLVVVGLLVGGRLKVRQWVSLTVRQ